MLINIILLGMVVSALAYKVDITPKPGKPSWVLIQTPKGDVWEITITY